MHFRRLCIEISNLVTQFLRMVLTYMKQEEHMRLSQ